MEVVKRAETTPCASLRCPTVTPVVYNTTGCTIPSCVSTTVVTSALPVPPGVCGVATDPPLTAPGCPDADYLCTKTRYTGLTQCPPIPCTSTYVPTVYSTVTTTIFVTPTDYTYTTFSTTSTSTTSTTTVPPPTSTSSV